MTNNEKEKSFAELFEASEMNLGTDLNVGDRIEGTIISVGKDLVYVDTGTKIDGVAEKQELVDEEGNLPFAEGDTLELFVVAKQQNEIRLGRTLGSEGGLEQLFQAMEGKIPVEGRVKETCKGGYRVRILGKTAFCPLSQIDIRRVDDPESMVGETFEFLITKLEANGRNIVVSRRAIQEKEQAESLETFTADVSPGEILQGRVTRVVPFGAFVEIAPGLEGLVHVSEMSWSRTQSPEEIVSPGDRVTIKLLNMEEDEKGKMRFELSMKQAEEDPWEVKAPEFKVGDKVTGTVTRTAPFGAFVEIAPGVDGLVHISEMSYVERVHKPEDMVSEGDKVSVVIKDVDLESRRIGLSMRDAEGDPWLHVGEKYKKGQEVQGSVENREQFGLFVQLEPGVTGLLPKSKMESAQQSSFNSLKPGDPVKVMIHSIDMDKRRITLAPAGEEQSEDWKSFAPKKESAMGTLGEQLQKAMKDKKK